VSVRVSPIVARQLLTKNSSIVARKRPGMKVTAGTNTCTRTEELLNRSFSMRSVSYEGTWATSSSQNLLFYLLIYTTVFDRIPSLRDIQNQLDESIQNYEYIKICKHTKM
jgi:hypothetical protein